MFRYLFLVLFNCVILISCSKERETYTNEELISIEGIQSKPYPADGNSRVELTISILPESADAANRTIKLESEGGTFNIETVNIPENSMKATAYFIPGFEQGTYDIKAIVQNKPEIFVTQPITLKSQVISDIITVSLDNTSNANGIDIKSGKIILQNTEERTIKLKLSDPEGVILPEEKNEITVEVNSSGEYNFSYRSSTNPGQYFLSVDLEDSRELKLDVPYYQMPVRSDQIIKIRLSDTTDVLADGERMISGTLKIQDYKLPSKVKLKLNQGSFLGSSNPKEIDLEFASINERSFSIIMSTTPSNHILTAEIEGSDFELSKIITSEVSFPDSLIVIPSAFEMDSIDGQVTLTTYLLKNSGKASSGVPISFKAEQDQNGSLVEVGIIETFPVLSDANQQAQSTYSLRTRNTIGSNPVIISAQVDVNGTLISSNSINLRLK